MKQLRTVKAIIAKAFFLFVPAIVWQILFLCFPLAIIAYISIHIEDAPWYLITLQRYATFLNPIYFHIISRSLLIAAGTALICLVCAYPVAYYLALKVEHRWKNMLLFLLALPFWTNFLIQVYSWFFILDRNGFLLKQYLLNLVKMFLFQPFNGAK